MTPEKYKDSAQVQRVCDMITVLAGQTALGMEPSQIAKACRTSAANVTRLLAQLYKAGFVEEVRGGGRWRLGPRVVQVAFAHETAMARIEHEIRETKQRYSREA